MKYLVSVLVMLGMLAIGSPVIVWAEGGHMDHPHTAMPHQTQEAETSEVKVEDEIGLVCSVMGGEIDENINYTYQGKKYYFCCPMCITKFKNNPEKYIKEINPGLSGKLEDGVRVVKIEAFKYGFDPDPIVVKKGETVRLELESVDVAHGFAINELGINLAVAVAESNSVEFVAEPAGDFHIHCSVYCGSGHNKMHGNLKIVE